MERAGRVEGGITPVALHFSSPQPASPVGLRVLALAYMVVVREKKDLVRLMLRPKLQLRTLLTIVSGSVGKR